MSALLFDNHTSEFRGTSRGCTAPLRAKTAERDAWDAFADSGNGIDGQWLKCAKGYWTLEDEPVGTGDDGLKMCIVMDTAIIGEVILEDKKITARNTGRISSGPPRLPNSRQGGTLMSRFKPCAPMKSI